MTAKPSRPPRAPHTSHAQQVAILLTRFTCNYNEAVLTAEISQTFFKFMGVTLLSSTIIWFIPLVIYIVVSPLFARAFLRDHPRVHVTVLLTLVCLLLFNTLAFSHLHYLETLAANKLRSQQLNLLAGILSFTVIDLSKMLFDFSLFQFVVQRVSRADRPAFNMSELLVGEGAKIMGGVVSCLYVLQQKTFSGRFSESFYTNIQFAYFSAGLLNAVTVAVLFICWPKEQVLPGQLKYPPSGPTYLSSSFPGLKTFVSLRESNQMLAWRKFFSIGLYYYVVLALTQWVSDLFTDRYSHSYLSNSMQVLDIGTSWGSVALSMFICIRAVMTIVYRLWGDRVRDVQRALSGWCSIAGGVTLLAAFFVYDSDIKLFITMLGLSGLGSDACLDERISEQLERDEALAVYRGFERRKRLEDLDIFIETLAYVVFVFLFPVIFFAVPDSYWILSAGLIHFGLFFWRPSFEPNKAGGQA